MNIRNSLLLLLTLLYSSRLLCQLQFNLLSGVNKYKYFDRSTGHYSATYTSPPYSWCLFTSAETTHKKTINWGAELMYTARYVKLSAHYGGLGTQNKHNADYRLNYLYLTPCPIFSVGKKFKLKISAGPSIGFLAFSRRQGTRRSYSFASWDTTYALEGMPLPILKRMSCVCQQKSALRLL